MPKKKISYKLNRSLGGPRKARKGQPKSKELNITSLIDILTILLVFLMKNVSMESQKTNVPAGMQIPNSYVNEKEFLEDSETILIRIYENKIAFGIENSDVGSLQDFISDKEIQEALLYLMNEAKDNIEAAGKVPAVMVQADSDLECKYITQFMRFVTGAKYSNIFFTTMHLEQNPWSL